MKEYDLKLAHFGEINAWLPSCSGSGLKLRVSVTV